MKGPGEKTVVVRDIDRWRSIYYAAASGDFNPIHIDDEVGKMAGLGGVLLPGRCTLALGCEAAVEHLDGDQGRVKRIKVRFSRPVRPGDALTFTVNTESVEQGRAKLALQAVNQNGEAVLSKVEIEAEVEGGDGGA